MLVVWVDGRCATASLDELGLDLPRRASGTGYLVEGPLPATLKVLRRVRGRGVRVGPV